MMEDLIKRLEEAEGPSRRLDEVIAVALGIVTEKRTRNMGWIYADGETNGLAAYTSSIDAAMTLVPEGYDWAVFRTNGGLTCHAWCGSREDVFGETPALALCAAALRARL